MACTESQWLYKGALYLLPLDGTVLEVTHVATVRICEYISADFKILGIYINGKYGWEYI